MRMDNIVSTVIVDYPCVQTLGIKSFQIRCILLRIPIPVERWCGWSLSLSTAVRHHYCLLRMDSATVASHQITFLAYIATHCAYARRDGQAELTWVADYGPR